MFLNELFADSRLFPIEDRARSFAFESLLAGLGRWELALLFALVTFHAMLDEPDGDPCRNVACFVRDEPYLVP